ncbi:3-oxoacyl-[acyl-carrier-protein] reductase [Desulfonema magnum]|uniref:3-oxoacyl-[acyl-carrier-protein] reductase n=1 Tax=Desulfonema magnum TaxID=45655 RepID=A0A975GUB5_9BACT|nr:3-oxoacyl-[acyl-carrier-protein] reductase [Desulfonema magnum]QTA93013.1 3-oxoacyl-[acyl-carrier-protein] reductase [Desulfonema magnum]
MSEQVQRTIVVTGGSRGIGRAICLALAGPDTHIYFNYFPADEEASKTEKLITDAGGMATSAVLNVASEKDVESFFDRILDETGRIDILVNNAGITRDSLLVRMKDKDWNDVIDINLKGTFYCTRAATKPMMKQRFGRIVNIASVVGASGNPGQANYVASKAGIIGLTKAVALELASRNITVNAVAPGFIETDMTAALPEKARDAMLSGIPLKRGGKPEDIAAVVAFLASENAAYITGQTIHVNGGMYM